MSDALTLILWTAAGLAAFHTLIGVDHSLPFVVIGRAQGWSLRRTLLITGLCGVGHTLSSVVLGLVGVGAGVALERLELLEAGRGGLAAWLLIAFGSGYAAWGLWRALKKRPHQHVHVHGDGTVHQHRHTHQAEHAHPHPAEGRRTLTVWALFVIFVLGPCETLIPLMMAPSLGGDWGAALLVAVVFSSITVGTMLGAVAAAWYGLSWVPRGALERWGHLAAGLAVVASGLAVQLLGI